MKRFCRVFVLAAVMVVPLLLVAGPALAVSPFEGNPPGKQIDGKHDINGRLIETSRDVQDPPVTYVERVEYDVRSSDPRLSGEMDLFVWDADFLPNGNVRFSGYWEIFDDDQEVIWSALFEGVESANYLAVKPFQLSVSGDAVGSGDNANLTLHYRVHRASADWTHPSKSTLILKARIDEQD